MKEIGDISMENPKFDVEAFGVELEKHFQDWKSKWVSPLLGPTYFSDRVYGVLSGEHREAERPEKEAREKFVNYSSCAIKATMAVEDRVQIISNIQWLLSKQFYGPQAKVAGELMTDIFKATIVELGKTEGVE